MESTTENLNTTPTPVASPATPTPSAPVAPPQAQAPAAPTQTPVASPTPNPIPPVQPAVAPTAPAMPATPVATAMPNAPVTPVVPETFLEQPAENTENEEEKKPAKLILNTQRILDDWKFERGKVLIFLMKFMQVMVVLGSISLFIMGFIGVIGFNIAISFLEPVAFLTRNAGTSQIMLIIATFLTIWVSFANKLTPYFKAFSIAKWLKNNKVDPKEVMKIFLQSRREKELTKYSSGRGGISAEKADLAHAAFILLNEDHKKSLKSEMICSLIFWFLISALKILFVFTLSGVVGGVCTHINEIIQKTASFDFMKLVGYALDPLFLASVGGWIVVGIASAITIACIAASRNKTQIKWIKAFMKEDMPSEEYYEE